MANIAIVGGSEETRLLLRGLLRLHHHRIIFEAGTLLELEAIPAEPVPSLLLLDVDMDEGDWGEAVQIASARIPGLRTVLITPRKTPELERRATAAGVPTILMRPFVIRELIETVQPTEPRSPTPTPPSP